MPENNRTAQYRRAVEITVKLNDAIGALVRIANNWSASSTDLRAIATDALTAMGYSYLVNKSKP